MKKLYGILLSMLLVLSTLTACSKNTYELSISTNRTTYDALSSSVQGITLYPKLKTNDNDIEVQYYWSTIDGGFIGHTGKEVVNTGGSFLWTPISEDSTTLPSTTTITLTAKDVKTDKVLATASLTISGNNTKFTVVTATSQVTS